MALTIEQIEREWGATVPFPEVTLEAFERVAQILGTEWIQSIRNRSGALIQGAGPLLQVISMGGRLRVLDNLSRAERLISKLKQGDASAEAELTAMHLLHVGSRAAEIEYEPDVIIHSAVRSADFRIRLPGEGWTFVEVTRPDISKVQERLTCILKQITRIVLQVEREFAVEVSFRREPSHDELASLLQKVKRFCEVGNVQHTKVADLASILLSDVTPGYVTVRSEPSEPKRPLLALATMLGGEGQPRRYIVARVPYVDQRAGRFLAEEARQLPRDHPGLIMVDATREPTAFGSWGPDLVRRFQPTVHTRVGGLCLFAPRLLPSANGLLWVPQVRLHLNLHAKLPLPEWISTALNEVADIFTMVFADIQQNKSQPGG